MEGVSPSSSSNSPFASLQDLSPKWLPRREREPAAAAADTLKEEVGVGRGRSPRTADRPRPPPAPCMVVIGGSARRDWMLWMWVLGVAGLVQASHDWRLQASAASRGSPTARGFNDVAFWKRPVLPCVALTSLLDVYVVAPPPPVQPTPPSHRWMQAFVCMQSADFLRKKKYITYFVLCFCFVSMYIYINVRQTSYIVSKFVIGCEVAMAQVCNSCFMVFDCSFFVNGVLQILQQMLIFLWWWWINCGLTTVTAVFQFLLLTRNVKVSPSCWLLFFPPSWLLPQADEEKK